LEPKAKIGQNKIVRENSSNKLSISAGPLNQQQLQMLNGTDKRE
jgi:hypothetical protein